MSKRFCTFLLNKFLFGVDVDTVQEVVRHQFMTRVPLAPPVVGGLINLRGQLVTSIDLRQMFNMPQRSGEEAPMHVVLRSNEGAVSLLVDEINDVIEVDEAAFEPAPETVRGLARDLITGVYKLEGRLLLDLSTHTVLDMDRWQGIAHPMEE